MKSNIKYFLLILSMFLTVSCSKAQYNSEFNYFSISGGLTHGLFNFQDLGETNKLLHIDGTNEQFINSDKLQANYSLGMNIGLYYNFDFRNNNMGITSGVQYHLIPTSRSYISDPSEFNIKENNLISSISLPLFFKYGKDFYEPMRYLFIGVQANYYLVGKSNYKYLSGTVKYKLSNKMLIDFTPGFFVGFNYNILNVKIEYSPFQVLKEGPLNTGDISENKGLSKHFIFLQTNINIPVNTWSRYDPIDQMIIWIRRLFR